MTLLESLLDAILRLDGEALVMHAGEKPYVILSSASISRFRGPLSWGQVELSSRPLSSDAVLGMLAQMLSPEQSQALAQYGAIEHEIDAPGDSGERFVVTAARGGEDVWVEVRRRSRVVAPPASEQEPVPSEPREAVEVDSAPVVGAEPEPEAQPQPELQRDTQVVAQDDAQHVTGAQAGAREIDAIDEDLSAIVDAAASSSIFEIASGPGFTIQTEASPVHDEGEREAGIFDIEANGESEADGAFELEAEVPVFEIDQPAPEPSTPVGEAVRDDSRPALEFDDETEEPVILDFQDEEPVAVVVPHARPTFKLHQPPPPTPAAAGSKEAALVELLRAAAGQRASTVYAVVDTRPMMRVDGQICLVGTRPSVAAGDVERFIFEFAPRDEVADHTPEWTCAIPGVGHVRCVTFHDQSGAGLIVHLPAGDAATADELGIPPEVQALCGEADGLIVIAGPRFSGKSTLLSAFVDLINRTRYDHVITIESQIRKVHEKRLSFISQREVRGDGEAIAAAARAALREGPDVLVIEDLRAPEALIAALDAARAGRLVFGSISGRTAPAAVERLIDGVPADRRAQLRASLAGSLRAVIAQLLVPKVSGGRIAAREVLFSSPAMRKLILNGTIDQLPLAIESGRGLGMRTMVDSLGALVREGVVSVADACTSAPDRAALVSALERDGVDVSGVERRA